MGEELAEIIKNSTFKVHEGSWVYASVRGTQNLDDAFMLSKDEDEVTAVFEESKSDRFDVIERNKDLRKLIEVRVSVPFYAIGSAGCNNLLVSTYSKDYVLVTEPQFEKAKQALLELGFKESE